MRTTTHLALAAFAVAAVAAAGGGPATADPPKCPQGKTTCADSLKAVRARRPAEWNTIGRSNRANFQSGVKA